MPRQSVRYGFDGLTHRYQNPTRSLITAAIGSAEQPRLSAQGDAAQRSFRGISLRHSLPSSIGVLPVFTTCFEPRTAVAGLWGMNSMASPKPSWLPVTLRRPRSGARIRLSQFTGFLPASVVVAKQLVDCYLVLRRQGLKFAGVMDDQQTTVPG